MQSQSLAWASRFIPQFSLSSASSAILLLIVAQAIYLIIKGYLEYQADSAFGARHGCQPPPELPYRWPLGIDRIKDLWDSNSEGRLLEFLCSIAKNYEPRNNLTQFLLFGPRAYHVLHPKNVEAVLSTNFQDYGFGVRHGVFSPLLGNGIFTQEGAAWKHSRELLRKQFMRTQYQNLGHFQEHVNNLLAQLPAERGIVDLQPLFFSLTLDTTTALLLGRSVYSLKPKDVASADDEKNRAFAEDFTKAQEGLAKRFRLAPFHFLYNPPRFRRACAAVHRFVEAYIEEMDLQRQRHEEDSSAKTEELYGFINQVAQESATKEDLRDQLLNVLLAGRDTTACCLSWTFRLLVRNPDVMVRLRHEVSEVMGENTCPSRQQIRRMPYLDNVITESLRLYPPVPLNNRTATQTTLLPTGGGPEGTSPILVRRGELVVFSSYVNSRARNLYGADAAVFRPDRWADRAVADVGWAYFPFNGGPRACLGQDFARMEVAYTVVRLLCALPHIVLPPDEPNCPPGSEKQRLSLVLSCAEGCRVEIERRRSAH